METIEITLQYKDGSTWFAGAFESLEKAQEWILKEKLKIYWDAETQVQIVTIPRVMQGEEL